MERVISQAAKLPSSSDKTIMKSMNTRALA